jgi:BirA family biotin operon repressor/biotin-[acetyl-CoA-carboxylase] ligase
LRVFQRINADKLQEGLPTKRFGRSVFFRREVGSTNDWAKDLAELDAEEGTVAIAETQTAGHGRLGREWFSPRGGLWFSVILRPKMSPSEAVGLVFVAGLAVAEVLQEKYGLEVETKWPNDVLVNGKKVCGILAEMNTKGRTVNFVVMGFGVNVNFLVEKAFLEPLRKTVTSLEKELGQKVQLEALFKGLLEKLESRYEQCVQNGLAFLLAEWKKYSSFLGRKVEVRSRGEKLLGVALDVEGDGALVIRLEDGSVERILVGDVSLRL